MRTWARANRDVLCGGCGKYIHEGDPLLLIRIPGIRDRVRCDHCEGPAPPELPPVTVENKLGSLRAEAFTRIGKLAGSLPRDWKTAQAEREPGSDDE